MLQFKTRLSRVQALAGEPLSRTASVHCDFVRAVAALIVMLGHARGLLWVEYSESHVKNPFIAGLYFVTGFGHQCVIVFFVLSGLLIMGSAFRNLSRGTWSWSSYALDRATRLYVVLIPGLVLGYLCDLIGSTCGSYKALYSEVLPGFGFAPGPRSTFAGFLANLAFLQNRFVPPFASNSPLWSLSNEAWYYALFAALIVVASGRSVATRVVGGILACCFTVAFVGTDYLVGWIIWLMGGVVRVASSLWHKVPIAATFRWISLVVFGAVLAAGRVGVAAVNSDVVVAIVFCFVLFGLLEDNTAASSWYTKLSKTGAAFSYTLYVVHFPFLLMLRALLLGQHRLQPTPGALLLFIALCFITIVYAFVLAKMTESNTAQVRAFVAARIARLVSRPQHKFQTHGGRPLKADSGEGIH